jgi:hypothetical protein
MIIVTSCSKQKGSDILINQKDRESLPGIDIPLSDYNTKIKLVLYPGESTPVKNGYPAGLIIVNMSDDRLIFPPDFGVKIFEKRDEGWPLVENNMSYGEGDYLMETNRINPAGLSLDIIPFLQEIKSPVEIRIVVVGHVEGKPSEKVGAFIDLPVSP